MVLVASLSPVLLTLISYLGCNVNCYSIIIVAVVLLLLDNVKYK